MKITKQQMTEIYSGLKYMDGLESDVNKKLALYAIPKNLDLLEKEMEIIKKLNPTQNNSAWTNERMDIIKQYAKVDDNGKIIEKDNGEADIPDDKRDEVLEKLKPVDEKYGKESEELKKIWDETMLEEIEFDFYMIKESWLPEKMNNKALKFLQPIIELED